ncbi:hypothetical protein FA849_17560 [Escherichia coli]|nr:hypothetical protein [Escherichia coli]
MDKIILPTGFLPMLTVKQIEAAKPKEKPYRLLDGNDLYIYGLYGTSPRLVYRKFPTPFPVL